jgi:hypothetical protein
MPVSKNTRKSRKGQNRKKSRAKEANNLGGSGFGDQGDSPVINDTFPLEPHPGIPGVRTVRMSIGGGSRYKVTSPPDNPSLSEMEQINAIIERSVSFEMTEAHHDNIGLREMDLDGEMSGGDIPGPMVARVDVDPLSTIEGHPKWKTGQELINYLDSDPNVFREEFDGNRWQGLGNQRLRKRSSLPPVRRGGKPCRDPLPHSGREPSTQAVREVLGQGSSA